MRPLVVVPTYNERENVELTLKAVLTSLDGAEVLVVDDSSPDGTGSLVTSLATQDGRIHLLTRTVKEGLGPAYLAGFAWGMERGFDVLVEMDADGQHDPGALPHLIEAVNAADMVIGSRYIPGGSIPRWSLTRRMISRFGNIYASALLGLKVSDLTSGFKAIRADLLQRMDLSRVTSSGYGFQIQMTYEAVRVGGRVREVPIRCSERSVGESKMSMGITVEAFSMVTTTALKNLSRRFSRSRGR